jgi:hypothetical protein
MNAAFPLILTFSRREKGQPLAVRLKRGGPEAVDHRGFAKTLGAILPLPAGAGRGEGEHANYFPALMSACGSRGDFSELALT